eukprot:3980753-Amphidinium_carterae.1
MELTQLGHAEQEGSWIYFDTFILGTNMLPPTRHQQEKVGSARSRESTAHEAAEDLCHDRSASCCGVKSSTWNWTPGTKMPAARKFPKVRRG